MEKNETCPGCEFDENLAILREIYFFSELPLESLKVLAYLCTRESFKPGDYLFRQHDDDGQAFYIVSGEARLTREDESGTDTVRDFESGAFTGSLALLGAYRRLFSLQALADMTCLVLTRPKFVKVMEQFPAIQPKILQAVVGSIYSWEKKFLAGLDKGCETCRRKVGVSLV